MGFKAKKVDKEYLSFQIDSLEWSKLKRDKQFKSDLYMACCKTKAIMKTSSLGLQYFAHYRKGNCIHTGESMEHMILKKELYEILLANNYKVEIEKELSFDSYTVRPDVYLQLKNFNIAFEIQVTSQSIEQMFYRSKKYNDNGIHVIWLNLFSNRTYIYTSAYTSFNYENLFIKMYRINVESKNNTFKFKIDNLDLFDFVLNKLKLSISEDVDIEKNKNEFFYRVDDLYYYINKEIIVNNFKMKINQNWLGYGNTIERGEQDYTQVIKGVYLKGFILKNFTFLYKIKKSPIELNLEDVEDEISIKEFKSIIKNIAINEGWEITFNKKHTTDIQSHVYMKKNSVKLLFMINEIGNYEMISNFCKKRNIEYIILSNEINYSSYFNPFYQIYKCGDSFKTIVSIKTNQNFEDWFINNLKLSLKEYPMNLINDILIDDYVSVNNCSHIIMAKEKIRVTKNPKWYINNIKGYPFILKSDYTELIIKGEYLYGFKRYELNEVLI